MKKAISIVITFILFALIAVPTWAQKTSDYKIVLEPSSLSLEVDDTTQLNGTIQDGNGNTVQDSVAFYSRDAKSVPISADGSIQALKPGTFEIIAYALAPDDSRLRKTITVQVAYPPITDINFVNMPGEIYNQTTLPIKYEVTDAKGFSRDDVDVQFSSSDDKVAHVGQFEKLHTNKKGSTTITATVGDISASWMVTIIKNPVASIALEHKKTTVKTGEVVHFKATPKNDNDQPIKDAPISFSFNSQTDDNLGESASGQIQQDGRFVANKAGLFTITATSGSISKKTTIRVNTRNVQKSLKVVGHGLISEVHTSDLWVWEGIDGRDYAITGTWGGDGETYFWDVSNPADMTIIDTVTVDARTVNDVKISEDGRLGIITREGASDRKNGIVILDVSDPHNVSIITEYTKGLTGGVHNSFIYKDHVFAVNNGRRYDIIDISDPKNPKTVSRFELDTPGHSVHDVWVENGIAYSSNWDDGIVAVDVGSTPAAQSPERHNTGAGSFDNPVKLGSYTYPSGWNHAAFPFKSQSTGDFYIIAGDEAFPNGLNVDEGPTRPAGWIHFVKFEGGWDTPKEVARYQIPEAGTHNFWVKDDTLYIAYYNAGLRVVDISGELMGNLYEQGREIAKHIPTHPEGHIPNAAMTWGPQPYKGYIFVSDWNSGIWAYKLEDKANQ
ncbi:LVIVD repeat-containing protein [Fodinibius saliphilus]|uniref:LVIVD repeat-containing protein n=1 Tax=Fodinibius saliphilus TaxID=1920650 RepID=UPI001108D652|nr:hypothetical protein [Fodinibius saliphilus]